MASFPTSLVTPTDPTSGNFLSSPSHSQQHQSHNGEIVAVETKIGTGSSTPSSGKVLRATGTGTSSWSQLDVTTDVASFTSANLRTLLSDETGTGAAVFGTSPTVATPIVSGGTFATPVITTPQIVTSVNDTNGNEIIRTPATASAVNDITVTNAATGSSPRISATGSDSNPELLLSGKGTGSARFSGIHDGWVDANETLTYASATTFTCSAALAAILGAGDRIKLTQTTVKYFYVVSVSGTTITVTGGSDYTLANAAITLPFYSHAVTPVGFPGSFAFAPTKTGWTSTTKNVWQLIMVGKDVRIYFDLSGTSNSTSTNFTSPVAAKSISATNNFEGTYGLGSDNGSVITQPRWTIDLSASATVCNFFTTYAGGGWTASGTKQIRGYIMYEAV